MVKVFKFLSFLGVIFTEGKKSCRLLKIFVASQLTFKRLFNIRNTFLIALAVTALLYDFIPARNQMSKVFAMKENEKEMNKKFCRLR